MKTNNIAIIILIGLIVVALLPLILIVWVFVGIHFIISTVSGIYILMGLK